MLAWSRNQFPGTEGRESETRILLGFVTGLSSADLIAHGDESLTDTQIERFKKMTKERQRGIPISYLTGTREFWSIPLFVNNQVLIPRHETEILVERVLEHIAGRPNTSILELGTGSGAVALALASELPDAYVIATDTSVSALVIAQHNLDRSGLQNVELLESDWFSNLGGNQFDLICSNPPYISPDDAHLQQGDVRFEPRDALVADECGYGSIRRILTNAKEYLVPGGLIVIEHGFQQGKGVRSMMSELGFTGISTHQDLSENDRVTEGRTD